LLAYHSLSQASIFIPAVPTDIISMDKDIRIARVWPEWELPVVSHGLPYPEACAKHVSEGFGSSRVYIIVSKSLAVRGDYLQRLRRAIGEQNIAGVRMGMRPHTMYTEVIEIAKDLDRVDSDCMIVLGGGSLIDGGKGAILVSLDMNDRCKQDGIDKNVGSSKQSRHGYRAR